jgi:broad specificity phosphatase PhoE
MRLTLICHGATSATRAAAFPIDEPIEATSVARAEKLGRALGRVDRAWTSPALRARQTAAVLGLAAEVAPALRDCDYGYWSGRTFADLERTQPADLALWLSDVDAVPHGGESVSALVERVSAWLDEVSSGRGYVVAVTHASVVRAAIARIVAAPTSSFWRIDVAPLSVSRLGRHAGRWTLRLAGGFEAEPK